MNEFNVGDVVEFFGKVGTVEGLHVDGDLMVRRVDGVAGPAWEGTKWEGLWCFPASKNFTHLIRQSNPPLENK